MFSEKFLLILGLRQRRMAAEEEVLAFLFLVAQYSSECVRSLCSNFKMLDGPLKSQSQLSYSGGLRVASPQWNCIGVWRSPGGPVVRLLVQEGKLSG